jgi:hypothetical protein
MSILWNFDKYAKIEELPFDPLCINENYLIPISDHELLLKAGTPLALSGEGEIGTTAGTVSPVGWLGVPTCFAAEDYHFILTNAQQPKLVKCVTKGYIEKAKVLEALDTDGAGALDELAIEAADPTADWAEGLASLGLYLVDDLGALPGGSGGGGSGGSVFIVTATYNEEQDTYVCDKTWKQISDAFNVDGVVTVIDSIDYSARTGEVMRHREYVVDCSESELGYNIDTTGASYSSRGANGYPVREE